jgi:hypothetical protein
MAAYAFIVPILPGQEETDQRLFAVLPGPRWGEKAKTRERKGPCACSLSAPGSAV